MLKSLEKPLFVTSLPNRGFINLASPASALSQRETPKASRESQGERGSSRGESLWQVSLAHWPAHCGSLTGSGFLWLFLAHCPAATLTHLIPIWMTMMIVMMMIYIYYDAVFVCVFVTKIIISSVSLL